MIEWVSMFHVKRNYEYGKNIWKSEKNTCKSVLFVVYYA